MKTAWLIVLLYAWALLVSPARADLAPYAGLQKRDETLQPLPLAGVRITYLGTNAYLLEARGCVLLIDPYFSRAALGRVLLDLPVASDPEAVRDALLAAGAPARIDAVLVTHGHIDHLLDAPQVIRQTGARLIASKTSAMLAQSAGVSPAKCQVVTWGDAVQVGPARVMVLAAAHDRVLGRVPFPGERQTPGRVAFTSDWVCGEPLAFLVSLGGKRIYIDSGGGPGAPGPRLSPVDLVIAGAALPDSRNRLPALLRQLRPRFFLPSHQDDFFRPLSRGFSFGLMTDFPEVLRVSRALPPTVMLLDYFKPWTLR